MLDPYDFFEIKEAQDAAWLASRPVCDICGEPIQEDGYYEINGERWCEGCVKEQWKYIDD